MTRQSAKFGSIAGRITLFVGAFLGVCVAAAVDHRLGLIIAWSVVGFATVSMGVAIFRK